MENGDFCVCVGGLEISEGSGGQERRKRSKVVKLADPRREKQCGLMMVLGSEGPCRRDLPYRLILRRRDLPSVATYVAYGTNGKA